jgi:glycosyltransferase involved in cell wall biosynthesis
MRVLAVVHQFPPEFETGTEVLCLRTMQELATRGHDVHVVAADPRRWRSDAIREDRVDGVEVTRIPTRGRPRLRVASRGVDEFERKLVGERLLEVARAFAPDLVHAFHAFHFGIGAVRRLAQGMPLMLTATDFALVCPYATLALPDGSACDGPARDGGNCAAHHLSRPAHNGLARAPGILGAVDRAAGTVARAAGMDDFERIRSGVLRRLEASRRLAAAARCVVATSDRIRAALLAIGASGENVVVLPHQPPPIDVPAGPVGDPLRIGFLGSLLNHKGAHVLLDAVRRLPADLRCKIIVRGDVNADPKYTASLRARAKDDPRVRIVDRVPHSRFGEALGEVDLVVVPSIWSENAPIVLLSALAAGRYVVVSNVPGLAGTLNGPDTGRAFPVGDSDALAAILSDLIRDPTPVHRARQRAAGFGGFAGYVDRLEAIYRDAAGPARTRRPGADGTVA